MRRRVACIVLPDIRVEIAAANEIARAFSARDGAGVEVIPLAVVVARPGGTVKTERDVLGATKLGVVSLGARAYGVRAGQTVAAARARCSELRVRIVLEEDVRAAIERVAEAALAFGPAVAFDMAHDVVWIEVGGCAHLHGGEHALAAAVDTKVRALGHVCRVAIADGPRIASAVARFGHARKVGNAPMIVPEGKGAAAMRVLPLGALALDPAAAAWLDDLGLRSCGALQKLPRRSLGTRLGARAHDVMQLLDGEDCAPLVAWRPPEVPEERVTLEWGVNSVEALSFVAKALCDRLAVRLENRALAVTHLDFVLDLDRALCGIPGAPGSIDPRHTFGVVLPSPIARAADLFAVVRARLERESLAAPALAVALRASGVSNVSGRTLDLLTPEPKADRALPRLVAEIAAELGPASVGTLELVDAWNPDRRTRLVPFGASRAGHRRLLVTSALEPSRLVRGGPIPSSVLDEAEPLVRIEAVEWWRQGIRWSQATSADRDDATRLLSRHDWLATWTHHIPGHSGADFFALAWVERVSRDSACSETNHPKHGDLEATLRGWVD
jgi:protein ImuB